MCVSSFKQNKRVQTQITFRLSLKSVDKKRYPSIKVKNENSGFRIGYFCFYITIHFGEDHRFFRLTLKFLCNGIAITTVIRAESISAIGCAYKIPFNPHASGKIKITGMKQMPCRQAPRINPSFPFPRARNKDEYTV